MSEPTTLDDALTIASFDIDEALKGLEGIVPGHLWGRLTDHVAYAKQHAGDHADYLIRALTAVVRERPSSLDPRNDRRDCTCERGWVVVDESGQTTVAACERCRPQQHKRQELEAPAEDIGPRNHLNHRRRATECNECREIMGLAVKKSEGELYGAE